MSYITCACTQCVHLICTANAPRVFLQQPAAESTFRWEAQRGCLAWPTRRMLATQVTGHSLHRLNWLRMFIPFKSIVHIFLTLAVSNVEKGLVGSLLAIQDSEYK